MKDLFIKQQIKLLFLSISILIFLSNDVLSLNNKIKYKINNQIVTSIDIEQEMLYLLALNPNLKRLNEKEILEISQKSILNEKIKEQEIKKFFKKKEIPTNYLNKLLKTIYTKIGITNLEEFKIYLNNKNIIYQDVINKITIEALWNEIIVLKFSSKIKVDEDVILKEIKENKSTEQKSFLMSEIFFELNKDENLNEKLKNINETIDEDGFENAALKFSISQTANVGGKLDWINENSLNKNIREKINLTKKGNHTKPIRVASGFLILKINEIKITKSKINIKEELKKIKILKRNDQLSQFSKIYFNKIKKNMVINEI